MWDAIPTDSQRKRELQIINALSTLWDARELIAFLDTYSKARDQGNLPTEFQAFEVTGKLALNYW